MRKVSIVLRRLVCGLVDLYFPLETNTIYVSRATKLVYVMPLGPDFNKPKVLSSCTALLMPPHN